MPSCWTRKSISAFETAPLDFPSVPVLIIDARDNEQVQPLIPSVKADIAATPYLQTSLQAL